MFGTTFLFLGELSFGISFGSLGRLVWDRAPPLGGA